MERYVIVCLIKGPALDFHEKLVGEVCSKFNVKRQRLPAHFTIKAPFETDNIIEIQQVTEEFCNQNEKTDISMRNFGHFRDSVVFMDVIPSKEAIDIHDKYIDALSEVKWLDWKKNEGKGRVFHCTVVTKLFPEKFKSIWSYVNKFPFSFDLQFDNISILRWEKDKWVTFKEYVFKI
jgi:2'-5' RNA ligase